MSASGYESECESTPIFFLPRSLSLSIRFLASSTGLPQSSRGQNQVLDFSSSGTWILLVWLFGQKSHVDPTTNQRALFI